MDFNDSDLLWQHGPRFVFLKSFRQGFCFVTTHLFVVDLTDSKLHIIDFTLSGVEINGIGIFTIEDNIHSDSLRIFVS